MLDKSSEAYGEKGYKWGNHLFYTPSIIINEEGVLKVPGPQYFYRYRSFEKKIPQYRDCGIFLKYRFQACCYLPQILLQTARLNTPLLCPSPHPICVSVCVCPEGLCSCSCRVRAWRSVSWPANKQVSVGWRLSLVTSCLVVTCPVSCRRRMYLCV